MLKQTAVIAILAASLLTTGCDDDDDDPPTVTGPEALFQVGNSSNADAPTVGVEPLTLTSQFFGFGPCPAVQPFGARVNVVILAGNVNVALTNVGFQFVDSNRITQPQVTLPMPVPTTQFGTALVQARSTRLFPFDFRFGCGTSRSGTATFFVTTRDARGRDMTNEVRATVN